MKSFRFIILSLFVLAIAVEAKAASIVFGTAKSLTSTNKPDNMVENVPNKGRRFGFHSFEETDSGLIAKARSGASISENPISFSGTLDAEASQKVTRTFKLVRDTGDKGKGLDAILNAKIDGNFFGGAAEKVKIPEIDLGFITIPEFEIGGGSYKGTVFAKVTAGPFDPIEFMMDFEGEEFFGFQNKPTPFNEEEEKRAFLPFDKEFDLSLELRTTAEKTDIALVTSDFSSSLNASITPIPEPLTILGSGLALGFGAYFKKEHSRKQKKEKAKA